MSRKPLSIWEKQRKQEFDEMLRDFSLSGLKNIIEIANKSLDHKTKLQANIYLLDKCIGKNYILFDGFGEDKNDLTINLQVMGNGQKEFINNTNEAWESDSDDEDWGTEIYKPNN